MGDQLRGIRKRSISMDSSAVKINKSVCFYSPDNMQMPIDVIDRIMEMSHNKENMSSGNPEAEGFLCF